MTDHEFSNWLRNIRARFAYVAKFLDGMEREDKNQTTVYWFDQLRNFNVDVANAALDSMFNAAKKINPGDWFQAFMTEIRKVRSERDRSARSASYRDGDQLGDCRFGCSESGIVFIVAVSPRAFLQAMEQVRVWLANPNDQRRLFFADKATAAHWSEHDWRSHLGKHEPMAVACSCVKGDGLQGNGMRRFIPGRDQLARDVERPPTPHWSTQKEMADTGAFG